MKIDLVNLKLKRENISEASICFIDAFATRSVQTEPKLKPLLKQKEAIMTKMKSLKHSAAARMKGSGEGRLPWSSCPFGRLKANKIEQQQQQQQQKGGREIQKIKGLILEIRILFVEKG